MVGWEVIRIWRAVIPLPADRFHPGCAPIGKFGVVFVAPDGLCAFEEAEETAAADFGLCGFDEEGAAAAGADEVVDVADQVVG